MFGSESCGGGKKKSREWNPMRDDYENSKNGPQREIPLDHCRLHITNIPISINEHGLNAVFSKFGNLLECYLSQNPQMRYGLVRYQSPGEAKTAIAQLNGAEPMRLRIRIARRSNSVKTSAIQDDSASVISMSRQSVRGLNSNEDREYNDLDMACHDLVNMPLEETNVDVELELRRLKVQHLRVQYAKEMSEINAMASSLKTGQTSSSKSIMTEDVDKKWNGDKQGSSEYSASRIANNASPPATTRYIQRQPSRVCFNCGIIAEYYCSQCKVAPYCSEHCHQNDWVRHESVCRSLKTVGDVTDENICNDGSSIVCTGAGDEYYMGIYDNLDGTATICGARPYKSSPRHSQRSSRSSKMPTSKPFPQLRRPYVNKLDSNPGPKRYQGDGGGRFSKCQGNSDQDSMVYPPGNQSSANARSVRQPNSNKVNKSNEKRDAPAGPRKPAQRNEEEEWELPEPKSAPVEAKPAEVKPPAIVATRKLAQKESPAPVDAKPVGVKPVVKAVVPEKYLVETLSVGDKVLLSVEAEARACAHDVVGFVCLSMHDTAATNFEALIDPYKFDCEADSVEMKIMPGDTFSFYKVEDDYWYRARCLTASTVALIDNAAVTTSFGSANRPRRLAEQYAHVPEFCCVLVGDGVKVGDSLLCRIIAKDSTGVRVSITNTEGGDQAETSGLITRWLPKVVVPAVDGAAAAVVLPTPPRPDLIKDTSVAIVTVTDLKSVFVLPLDLQRQYDKIIYDAAVCGQNAAPLPAPPSRGDLVLAQYSENGVFYRALVCRINAKAEKYMVEYVDYGNKEITSMEKLRVCPEKISIESNKPLVSRVEIACNYKIVPAAMKYLESLRDTTETLKLTLPDNAASASSGSAAILTVSKDNENVNNKIIEMCTPEWKTMEMNGEDIMNVKSLTIEDVEYSTLEGPELLVLSTMFLSMGQLHACSQRDKHMDYVFGDLSERFQQFCESDFGGRSYMPRVDELCFCKLNSKWVRAVLIEHRMGEPHGRVFCLDHALVHTVNMLDVRKMLPEFVRGVPAVACEVQIKGFPEVQGNELLKKANSFMGITEKSVRGSLKVEKVTFDETDNMYVVEAPSLIRALAQ